MNRRFRTVALAAASLLALGAAPGCATDSNGGGTRTARTSSQGVAVAADAESTMMRLRGIVEKMTSDPLMKSGNDSFRTTVDGSETTVRVESTGSQASSVYVTSKNPAVVNRIESAIRR